jgi:Rrf2 family iron-sulfur cluster assembly transcriptional regulator
VLNQTAIYAIRAMGFLAQQDPEEFVLSSTIASEMNIPRNFLSKILNRLTQAGLIAATRGRGGGVRLARPGSGILLNEVVLLFMKPNDYRQCFLGLSACDGRCGLHLRWRIISEQLEQMLTDTTIDKVLSAKSRG